MAEQMQQPSFAKWLQSQMKQIGWNQAELSRRAGVSNQSISLVLSGQRPGQKVIEGLARALSEHGITQVEIAERAGRLPPMGNLLPAVSDFNRRLLDLDDVTRRAAIRAMDVTLRAVETAARGIET